MFVLVFAFGWWIGFWRRWRDGFTNRSKAKIEVLNVL
jgi:hypothetical protein